MTVICINDKGRPDEIPVTRWVREGERYTVERVIKCLTQPGQPHAYVLAELSIAGFGAYRGFNSSRFVAVQIGPEVEKKEEEAIPC